ncbi:MAG TPA: phospholipase D-like domain-containing protein [Thermoanaerobaculia bacterium]|nr:phospholipase D-like domain-containing protein [Thermoanaerobaculia bacterium]
MVQVSVWILVALVGAIVVLALLLWSVQRERESHVKVPDLDRFTEALPSIAGLTRSAILPGNAVTVLQDGDGFFPPLFRDIAAARDSIHIETYVWWEGEICSEVAAALAAKARAGVEVRLTLDAVGAQKMDDGLRELMLKAGVRIVFYHVFHWTDLGLFNNRTHRKVAVFDGRVAYVFGHGIAQEWVGRAQDAEHWRDTGLRLEGPIVNAVQAVFAENWMEETSEVLAGERFFPLLPADGPPAGQIRAQMISSSPHGGVSETELLLKLAIASARERLLIQNPYFIPDAELVEMLGRAVARGVEVRIMVPGPVTDSATVKHAGHYYFEELLRHGVKLYEYQLTLSHQKVMVIDGLWSLVGSTNFDDRSLDINDEASVGIIDRDIAAQLTEAFERDLESAVEFRLDAWQKRGAWHRIVDRVSYSLNEQL